MRREPSAQKPRRGGRSGRPPVGDLVALTIQVDRDYRTRLALYLATTKDTAGGYLQRQTRRDLEERTSRIVGSWTAATPTPTPGTGPVGPQNGPPALPDSSADQTP
jgi:hypothetical protein